MQITNRLRDIRFEYKLDQNDFAEYLGVNKSQYNKWEKQNGQPNLERVLLISCITGRSIHDIVELSLTEDEQIALTEMKIKLSEVIIKLSK